MQEKVNKALRHATKSGRNEGCGITRGPQGAELFICLKPYRTGAVFTLDPQKGGETYLHFSDLMTFNTVLEYFIIRVPPLHGNGPRKNEEKTSFHRAEVNTQ